MRMTAAAILAILSQALLGVAGAAAGAYAGFRLVLPSDPHCGLAVLPAMFFGGGLGGFVGLAFGLTAGAMLKRASATPPPK